MVFMVGLDTLCCSICTLFHIKCICNFEYHNSLGHVAWSEVTHQMAAMKACPSHIYFEPLGGTIGPLSSLMFHVGCRDIYGDYYIYAPKTLMVNVISGGVFQLCPYFKL